MDWTHFVHCLKDIHWLSALLQMDGTNKTTINIQHIVLSPQPLSTIRANVHWHPGPRKIAALSAGAGGSNVQCQRQAE